jgi:hypothetical protein
VAARATARAIELRAAIEAARLELGRAKRDQHNEVGAVLCTSIEEKIADLVGELWRAEASARGAIEQVAK